MRIKLFSLASLIMMLIILSGSAAYGQTSEDIISTGESLQKIRLLVDGIETSAENWPVQLASGRTVISLPALHNIVPCQSEWGPGGETVIIYDDKRIQLFTGKNEMLVNSVSQTLELTPWADNDGNLLLPLRAVSEALGYQIIYDETSHSIFLNSPGCFQILPQPPVTIDYSSMPTWGTIFSVPGLVDLWKDEQIITGYFTRLVNSPAGRTTNIALSAAKINGIILQPGEVFSFNRVVGPRTSQSGYQNAKIFAGKKVVTGIGGGVCQTSSTIYNLALESGMQILERYPHSLKVVYAPPNRDATVSWGGADFKFRNNKDYPVRILCNVDNGFVFAILVRAEPVDPVMPSPVQ